MAVMMIVIRRSSHKRNNAHWAPFELVARVYFGTDQYFPTDPKKESKAVHTISQNDKAHCRRKLSKAKNTRLETRKSKG